MRLTETEMRHFFILILTHAKLRLDSWRKQQRHQMHEKKKKNICIANFTPMLLQRRQAVCQENQNKGSLILSRTEREYGGAKPTMPVQSPGLRKEEGDGCLEIISQQRTVATSSLPSPCFL